MTTDAHWNDEQLSRGLTLVRSQTENAIRLGDLFLEIAPWTSTIDRDLTNETIREFADEIGLSVARALEYRKVAHYYTADVRETLASTQGRVHVPYTVLRMATRENGTELNIQERWEALVSMVAVSRLKGHSRITESGFRSYLGIKDHEQEAKYVGDTLFAITEAEDETLLAKLHREVRQNPKLARATRLVLFGHRTEAGIIPPPRKEQAPTASGPVQDTLHAEGFAFSDAALPASLTAKKTATEKTIVGEAADLHSAVADYIARLGHDTDLMSEAERNDVAGILLDISKETEFAARVISSDTAYQTGQVKRRRTAKTG